jgi:hypothetical protein
MKPLSASQVELYKRCNRRWAFKYCTNLPKPPYTPATELGTALHKIAEIYNQTARIPEHETATPLFMAGLPFVPVPKTGWAERRFDAVIDDVSYMGFQDWFGWSHNITGAPEGLPAILDYKTSSDPVKYGLSGKSDFLTHTQPLLYAAVAVKSADNVYMHWIYFRTKGKPKAYAISSVLTKQEVQDQFPLVVGNPAKEIVKLRVLKDLDPNALAPNRAACHDFGITCEYAAHCAADSEKETIDMGNLLEDLQDLCGDDTPAPLQVPLTGVDTINRAKRVSSRPPQSDRGVHIVAVDPAEVKKVVTQAPVAQPAQQPPIKQPSSKSQLAIILEEIAGALSRAAERIG